MHSTVDELATFQNTVEKDCQMMVSAWDWWVKGFSLTRLNVIINVDVNLWYAHLMIFLMRETFLDREDTSPLMGTIHYHSNNKSINDGSPSYFGDHLHRSTQFDNDKTGVTPCLLLFRDARSTASSSLSLDERQRALMSWPFLSNAIVRPASNQNATLLYVLCWTRTRAETFPLIPSHHVNVNTLASVVSFLYSRWTRECRCPMLCRTWKSSTNFPWSILSQVSKAPATPLSTRRILIRISRIKRLTSLESPNTSKKQCYIRI